MQTSTAVISEENYTPATLAKTTVSATCCANFT